MPLSPDSPYATKAGRKATIHTVKKDDRFKQSFGQGVISGYLVAQSLECDWKHGVIRHLRPPFAFGVRQC